MLHEGDVVKVIKEVNRDLPAGSIAEILSVHCNSTHPYEYPYELLGSFENFAADELELI